MSRSGRPVGKRNNLPCTVCGGKRDLRLPGRKGLDSRCKKCYRAAAISRVRARRERLKSAGLKEKNYHKHRDRDRELRRPQVVQPPPPATPVALLRWLVNGKEYRSCKCGAVCAAGEPCRNCGAKE